MTVITIKQKVYAKIDELENLLQLCTKDGETFAYNNANYDEWAAETNIAISTLRDIAKQVD
jgi:hypothetical protein